MPGRRSRMARKQKENEEEEEEEEEEMESEIEEAEADEEDDSEDEELEDPETPVIEPYTVLGVERDATADAIKAAYRKGALKWHPDKAKPDQRAAAHVKFQELAFAYAILSDPARRRRYDATGSTAESAAGSDDFNWAAFYRAQFVDAVTPNAIAEFARVYKGSDEERADVLRAYTAAQGSWPSIYERVMLSDPADDEPRFRALIDAALADGHLVPHRAYTHEPARARDARLKSAQREGLEAMEYAKELGVHDQLFGSGSSTSSSKKRSTQVSGEDTLKALIMSRHSNRAGPSFLDHLEAKYAAPKKSKASSAAANKGKGKGKKRTARADEDENNDDDDMPSEEAFQKAAARLNDRSTKRAKK